MKKALLLLGISLLLIGNTTLLKAQCYGVVTLDQQVTSAGTSSFSISTTFANELILISYDGWGFTGAPGSGPVLVDGNPATQIAIGMVLPSPPGNSGTSETWAYSAPGVGLHTIVCTEGPNYEVYAPPTGYYANFAASFYCNGGSTPLTVASLTSSTNTIPCNNGGPISDNITTTKPNSMIYCNAEYNEVTSATYSISWTDATFLQDSHIGDGIECSDAYAAECATGTYTITASNTFPNWNTSAFCGGLTIVLVDIPPTLATNCFTATETTLNPTCGNNNGSISISVVGGASPYTYVWTPNVTTTSSATGLSAGSYTIIVSDAACEDTTFIVTLTTGGPQITTNLTAGEKCFGDCNASVTENITGGVSPYTYSWAPGGQTTATVTGLCIGTYTFTVTDNNGCSGSSTVSITQPTQLTVTDVATPALCNGGTGNITATPAGGTSPYTYLWNPSAQTGATANGLSAGTYTTTVTDNNGCTATTSITITQPVAMTVSITGPATLCTNTAGTYTATLSGGTAPYTYAWSNSATTSTASITITSTSTYSVDVTDANGCTATGTINITLAEPPAITLTASRESICQGLSVYLTASSSNTTGPFTWEPGNLSGPSISVSPTVTTTYTVSVTGSCGTATTTITINVNNLPDPAFSADVTAGCYPLCIQFRDNSTSTSGLVTQWAWNFGNGDTALTKSPIYCYPSSGNYDVTLTVVSDSGCSASLNVADYVTVYSHPIASFSISPQPTTILNPTIQFTDKSTDAYGLSYWTWNFGVQGNDTLSNLQNPAYSYWDTGAYCVSEVVMNIHGCVDTANNCLVISPAFTIYIPDAFTPDGNGLNDVFIAKGNDVKNFEMYIFDRWGMQLFHSTNINDGWPGTVSGGSTVCQEDTYVYLINATDANDKKHTYIGKVSLIK